MWLVIVAALALGTTASDAISPAIQNFQRCRDGVENCDPAQLTEEQRRVVNAFASGRNFRECVAQTPKCDFMKLTEEQIHAILRLREEKKQQHAALLESARNFSACAYSTSECDESKLTVEQRQTLGRIVIGTGSSSPVMVQSITETEPPRAGRELVTAPPKESRAARFGRGLLTFLATAAEVYVEMEMEKAMAPAAPIIISGGTNVIAPSGAVILPGSNSVIETRIDGEFRGWSGGTVFKLQNGSIWQQATYAYHYHYAFSPKVMIYRSGSAYMMKVEGVKDAIQVRPLQPM